MARVKALNGKPYETATALAIVLTAGALFADAVPVTAPEEMRKVPYIYCSDLFHPAMDPDDHFDLAAVFRLKELDVKAVILDGHIDRPGQDQLTGGLPERRPWSGR